MEATTLLPSLPTLLIIDDEPLMTELFSQYMSRHGFHVLTAASGDDALRLADRYGEYICAIITDLTMPEMDGIALACHFAKTLPQIPVLVLTGHVTEPELMSRSPNIRGIVRKPFQNKALLQRIKEVIGSLGH